MADRIVARVATTQPVQVADMRVAIATEALEEVAESLNTRSAIRVPLEHDPYTVSTMKSASAFVEQGDEYDSLLIEMVLGEELSLTTYDTEMEYVFLRFPEETMPFARHDDVERLSVAVDLANFDELGDFENFKSVVSLDGTLVKTMERRSAIPDPAITVSIPVIVGLIVFFLLKPIYHGYSSAASKLTERIILKTAEYFAGLAMDKMNRKLKDMLTAYRNNQSVDARPVLVERVFTSEDVNIVLLERVDNDKDVEELELEQILNVLKDTGKIIFAASEITLVRDAEGKWRFWYLHTADGQVIATDEAMNYTADVRDRMIQKARRRQRREEE